MRVLFDITHPADAHLFRFTMSRLRAEGDEVLVTSREKDVATVLLDELGIPHVPLSRMGRGLTGMGAELVTRNARMIRQVLRFRPDVLVARIGISIGLPGALARVPRLVFEDTEHAWLQRSLSLPFATTIVTGWGYRGDHGARHVRFRGYPVMAYMAPEYFTPRPEVLRESGLDPDEPMILLRLVSWDAAHDTGQHGASQSLVAGAVERLSKFGRVLVSAEASLDSPVLERYRCPVPARDLHQLLARARLVLGEGGTSVAEAAVLGAPAIFTSPLKTGYLDDLEARWGLVRNVATLQEGVAVAEDWLSRPDLAETWRTRRERMLQESEDVTEFIVRLIRSTGTSGPRP